MNARCAVLAVLGILTVDNAQAANWVKLVGKKDRVQISVDTESIRTSDGMVQAWELFNFDTPDLFQGQAARSVKYLYSHNCAEHTVALVHGVFYAGRNGEGEVLSENDSSEIVYLEPIPGTIGARGLKFVCSYARKHKK